MAIYIFYTSVKIIISNIRGILTNDEGNDALKEEIKKEFDKYKEFNIIDIKIIKMSYYYNIFLKINVKENIRIKEFIKIEKKIKKDIKSFNKLIKYIDIEAL